MIVIIARKLATPYKYFAYFYIYRERETCFLEENINSVAFFLCSASFNTFPAYFTPAKTAISCCVSLMYDIMKRAWLHMVYKPFDHLFEASLDCLI